MEAYSTERDLVHWGMALLNSPELWTAGAAGEGEAHATDRREGWLRRGPGAIVRAARRRRCAGAARAGRSVAQSGSALDWGSRGRRFESARSDHFPASDGGRSPPAHGRAGQGRSAGAPGRARTCDTLIGKSVRGRCRDRTGRAIRRLREPSAGRTPGAGSGFSRPSSAGCSVRGASPGPAAVWGR